MPFAEYTRLFTRSRFAFVSEEYIQIGAATCTTRFFCSTSSRAYGLQFVCTLGCRSSMQLEIVLVLNWMVCLLHAFRQVCNHDGVSSSLLAALLLSLLFLSPSVDAITCCLPATLGPADDVTHTSTCSYTQIHTRRFRWRRRGPV